MSTSLGDDYVNCPPVKQQVVFEIEDNVCYGTALSQHHTDTKVSACKPGTVWKSRIPLMQIVIVVLLVGLLVVSITTLIIVTKGDTALLNGCNLSNKTLESARNGSCNSSADVTCTDIALCQFQLADNIPLPGYNPAYPAPSCAVILLFNSSSPSGYYWIRSSNGSAVHVYCYMITSCGGITGGWMRITHLDMTQDGAECPSSLELYNISNTKTCRINNSTGPVCSSDAYSSNGVLYTTVCGRVKGYQFNSTDAFRSVNKKILDEPYLDGVSITHGRPRQHIWSFTAALHEEPTNAPPDVTNRNTCPCSSAFVGTPPPSYVGVDYFCDTGTETYSHPGVPSPYFDNPLWDGAGCASGNTCCSINNPPWFIKHLLTPTADDVEMRVCRDQDRKDEDILIEQVEVMVR